MRIQFQDMTSLVDAIHQFNIKKGDIYYEVALSNAKYYIYKEVPSLKDISHWLIQGLQVRISTYEFISLRFDKYIRNRECGVKYYGTV